MRLPTLFVAHGSPMLLVDKEAGDVYAKWGAALPKPKAIVVFSAHWETSTLAFGEINEHRQLYYDYYGFPDELYRVQYPAPGAAWLAERIRSLLNTQISVVERGLDHGVFVPFIYMWPHADVPILQMTMPHNMSNQSLIELGEKLSPLRDEGVLIVGAGALTHNLRAWNPSLSGGPPDWVKQFDDWVEVTISDQNRDALLNWETVAPHAKKNHPTPEHFRPLLIAFGAANGDKASYPITGFDFAIFSRRCVQFNSAG